MQFDDERDYLMRMIKEVSRILFSLMLGKEYVQVELSEENKYTVSGDSLDDYLFMIDCGEINEAENRLLEHIDYQNRDDVVAATWFYKYLSGKSRQFMEEHNYSSQEVLDGLRDLAEKSGYGEICDIMENNRTEDDRR